MLFRSTGGESTTGNAGSTVQVLGGSGQGSVASGAAAAPVTFDTSKVKFTESPAFIALLVLGNIILLGGIAWIAVKLLL